MRRGAWFFQLLRGLDPLRQCNYLWHTPRRRAHNTPPSKQRAYLFNYPPIHQAQAQNSRQNSPNSKRDSRDGWWKRYMYTAMNRLQSVKVRLAYFTTKHTAQRVILGGLGLHLPVTLGEKKFCGCRHSLTRPGALTFSTVDTFAVLTSATSR